MATSLKDIMTDGKKLERMHQYENARHAVIKSYEYATRVAYTGSMLKLADAARELAKEMTKDLNETLKVLEDNDGVKANHS